MARRTDESWTAQESPRLILNADAAQHDIIAHRGTHCGAGAIFPAFRIVQIKCDTHQMQQFEFVYSE